MADVFKVIAGKRTLLESSVLAEAEKFLSDNFPRPHVAGPNEAPAYDAHIVHPDGSKTIYAEDHGHIAADASGTAPAEADTTTEAEAE